MNNTLTNTATAVGTYNSISTALTSEAVVVQMISGLTLTKTADKSSWADGVLTYTVTINNQTTLPYTAPVITDILDDNYIDFVADSVTINGQAATSTEFKYDTASHTLTVNLADIAAQQTTVVTFQVKKKA